MIVKKLDSGLHILATPIGTANDITIRALNILRDADILVAEDTRVLRKLMEIHGINLNGRKVLSYHDHNGEAQRPKIIALLTEGKAVAYASDAGTPLIADPGFSLAKIAIQNNITRPNIISTYIFQSATFVWIVDQSSINFKWCRFDIYWR